MADKRKRAAGGGRKSLHPDDAQSVKVMVRVLPTLQRDLLALAEKHRPKHRQKANLSAEIKRALQHWVDRHQIRQVHNSALGTAVAVLADRIEDIIGKKWISDPLTREVVRDRVEGLVSHILTPLSKHVTIPAEVKEDADLILSLLKGAMPRPGSPRLGGGTVIIDDRGLEIILKDLARDLGEGSVNVRAPDLLVARRERNRAAASNKERN
jgi:hypothetical protein